MAESNVSSTNGGIDFECFCKSGIQSYTFNPVNLADDKNEKGTERKMDRDIKKLSKRIKETIQDYETQDIDNQRRVRAYYIGKTYLKRKKRYGKSFRSFDRMDHKTWSKKGISSRYRAHKMKHYGHNGLVVLGVVTKDDVLPEKRAERIKQEDYALILEQRLVHHQLIEEADDRLVNKTFNEGKRQKKEIDELTTDEQNAYAYAIYMTLGCEEESEQMDIEETATTATVQPQGSKIREKKDTKRSLRRKKELDIDNKQNDIHRYFKKESSKVTFTFS